MEFKTFEFKLDEPGGKAGHIVGYASTFNNIDSYKDTIERGAFAKTLQERGHRLKVLNQHNWDEPIGTTVSAVEDEKGLRVEGQLLIDSHVPKADEAWALIQAGVIDGLSIGYRTVKDEMDSDTGIRTLKEIQLFEWSPVTFPADEHTTVSVKSARDLIEALRAIANVGTIADLDQIGPMYLERATAKLAELTKDYQALMTPTDPSADSPEGDEPPQAADNPEILQLLSEATDMINTINHRG